MSDKIVALPSARKGAIRCGINGVVFPQLYRLTGYCFKLKEGRELKSGMIEDDDDTEPNYEEPRAPAYTLGFGEMYAEIAEPQWTPINTLDPAIDKGWIVIRHHQSAGDAEAYLDAMFDTENFEFGEERFQAFTTAFGVFTIMRRMPNESAPDSLIVYKTKVPSNFPGGGTTMDWDKIISADGRELGMDDLDPPYVQGDFAPIKKVLSDSGFDP